MKRENEFNAEKIKNNLEKKGIIIELEQAQIIYDFIKIIADIAVNQYLRGHN